MAYAFAIPIKPGKSEASRQFGYELMGGSRTQEFDDLQRRLGAIRDYYFLQPSPEGDLLIVFGEGEWTPLSQVLDPEQNPFDRWFIEQFQEIYGVDLTEIDQTAELVVKWPSS
jgi:hypothetical protein